MANKLKSFARSERKRAFDRPFSIVGNLIDLFAGTDEEEEPTPLKQFDPNKDYYGPTGHGPFSAGDTPWPRYDEDVVAPFEFPDEFKDVGAVHNPWNKRTTEVSVLDGKTLERGKIANVVDARGTDAIDTDTNLRHEFRHKTIRENPNRSKIFELRKQMGMSEEAFTQLLDYKYARTPQERSKARVWLMHPTGGGFPQEPTEVLNLFSGHIDKIEKLAIEGSKRRVTDPRFRGPIEDSYQYGQLLKRQQEDPDFLALPPQERRETLDMQISPYLDSLQGAFERGMPGAVVNAMPPEPVDRGKTFGQFIDMRNEQVSAPWKKAMEGDAEAAYELAEGFVGGGITKVTKLDKLFKPSTMKSLDKLYRGPVGTRGISNEVDKLYPKLSDKELNKLRRSRGIQVEELVGRETAHYDPYQRMWVKVDGTPVGREVSKEADKYILGQELQERMASKFGEKRMTNAQRFEDELSIVEGNRLETARVKAAERSRDLKEQYSEVDRALIHRGFEKNQSLDERRITKAMQKRLADIDDQYLAHTGKTITQEGKDKAAKIMKDGVDKVAKQQVQAQISHTVDAIDDITDQLYSIEHGADALDELSRRRLEKELLKRQAELDKLRGY